MKALVRLITSVLVLAAFNLSAATLYVSLESTNPVAPYATWENAATNIQDAVDAAQAGDAVLVTNGVYAVGERDGNRVTITNSIRLESVNGPAVTTVDGGGSVRCVYLEDNAVLSGFTLTNGSAGGGAGGGALCESSSAVVSNCVVTGNSAVKGGGACGGTLYGCTLSGNNAHGWHCACNTGGLGGGASGSTLYDCTLSNNSAIGYMGANAGGGANACTLYNCTVTGNSLSGPGPGGGVNACTVFGGTLTGNWGSGGSSSMLYNCIVSGNLDGSDGTFLNCTVINNQGGISGTAFNCTVINNQGGIYGTAFNSIIYYNSGGNYGEGTVLNYCLTIPLPTNGIGNITRPPFFIDMAAGDFRLREDSPCIDAGTNLLGMTWTHHRAGTWDTGEIMVVGQITDPTDILGNTRFIDGNWDGKVAWDIGAYEFNSFRPPRFAVQPQLTAEGWKLNITGAPSKWVHLERSSNLKDWEEIWSGWMGADGVTQCTDSDLGQKVMFYRVIVP